MKPLPTASRLHELFEYRDGDLYWKPRGRGDFNTKRAYSTWNSRYAGKPAGHVGVDGYTRLTIEGRKYLLSRVIYAITTGAPEGKDIDHIDGDPTNNRIENLRLVSRSENSRNRRKTGNTFNGVCWAASRGKWYVQAKDNGDPIFIGRFDSLLDAVAARLRYNRENGYTMRHGR